MMALGGALAALVRVKLERRRHQKSEANQVDRLGQQLLADRRSALLVRLAIAKYSGGNDHLERPAMRSLLRDARHGQLTPEEERWLLPGSRCKFGLAQVQHALLCLRVLDLVLAEAARLREQSGASVVVLPRAPTIAGVLRKLDTRPRARLVRELSLLFQSPDGEALQHALRFQLRTSEGWSWQRLVRSVGRGGRQTVVVPAATRSDDSSPLPVLLG